MRLIFPKLGDPFVDKLLPAGAAIAIHLQSSQMVSVSDYGYATIVEADVDFARLGHLNLRDHIQLPTREEWSAFCENNIPSERIVLLDGILCTLLTILKVGAPNVWKMKRQDKFMRTTKPKHYTRTFPRIEKKIADWQKILDQPKNSLVGILRPFTTPETAHLISFKRVSASAKSIALTMPIAPSVTLNASSPYSDCYSRRRRLSVSFHNPPLAILVYLAGCYLLRGEVVGDQFFNLYLDLSEEYTIPLVSAPMKTFSSQPFRTAMQLHVLRNFQHKQASVVSTISVIRKTSQQPFVYEVNHRDASFLDAAIAKHLHIAGFWSQQLINGNSQLEAFLETPRWRTFCDYFFTNKHDRGQGFPCSEQALEAILTQISDLAPIGFPFSEGVRHYGYALRQLRRFHRAKYREIVDELPNVRTKEAFLLVMARAADYCGISSLKNSEQYVPSEADFVDITRDIHAYSIELVVAVLIHLSCLFYETKAEKRQRKKEKNSDNGK